MAMPFDYIDIRVWYLHSTTEPRRVINGINFMTWSVVYYLLLFNLPAVVNDDLIKKYY